MSAEHCLFCNTIIPEGRQICPTCMEEYQNEKKVELKMFNVIFPHFELVMPPDGEQMLRKIERLARICYKSENKIAEGSAKRMVRALIDNGHAAMIEHDVITVIITCDRGISHELVRHRIASYAQESTRYCNYSDTGKFGGEIMYINLRGGMTIDPIVSKLPVERFNAIYAEWLAACEDAQKHYMRMVKLGASPQIARSVLNHSTKTEIAVTMNIREWRHFFSLRALGSTGNPHPQMLEITRPMLKEFKTRFPVFFDDLGESKGETHEDT